MVKVGDKFIVEIDRVIKTSKGYLYGAKGMNTLVFDDNGIRMMIPLEKNNDDIQVGDEVFDTTDPSIGAVVGFGEDEWKGEVLYIVWCDGSCGDIPKDNLIKTGNRYGEVKSLLEKMNAAH